MRAIDYAPILAQSMSVNPLQVIRSPCSIGRFRIPVGSASGVAKSGPVA